MTAVVTDDRSQTIDDALARLDPLDRPSIERIAAMANGLWYLREKISGAPDHKSMLDHTRPLMYAALFDRGSAAVTFIKESASPTPDLEVVVDGVKFFAEVRKFGMGAGPGASDAVSKIVDAIGQKRSQLPGGAIGLVVIDNFDTRMEPGLAHDHILGALSEVSRRADLNPAGWRKPSGVIISAASVIGSAPVEPPHFLWINRGTDCPPSDQLIQWLLSSLPNCRLFAATNR